MNRMTRLILICLVLILLLFSSACEKKENEQAAFTFISQEIQPIEEDPFMLPIEISGYSDLHQLSVKKPQIDQTTDLDDIVHAILGSADRVANINSKDLVNNVYLETGELPINKSLSDEDGYLRAFLQRKNIDEENIDQKDGTGLWGDLYLGAIEAHTFGAGTVEDCSNCAILIKYRSSGVNAGNNIGFSNSNVSANMHIDNNGGLHFWSNEGQNQNGYSIENTSKEYINLLRAIDNEWYYALVAMDEHLGYRFITWQVNNPANNAFYACDLSGIFKPDNDTQGQHIWADISINSHANEAFLDIESIAVYEFENFVDIENDNLNDDPEVNTYSNDQEKYELAIQFFEAEDYYNAYTLLKELDGYDTGDHLAECERLLKTIEIENPYVSGMIKKAMKERGLPIYEYLYVYQAEKLESLDLSKCRIEDLGFIHNFPNLKELILDSNAISDVNPLNDLYSLESLSLGKNNISDITPLNKLANLQYLDLNNNLLEDVSALNNLPSLREINLSTNNIIAIADLHNLVNLESIDLSYNLISSISSLENSPIKVLNIMNTDINNLDTVANFTELEELKAGFRYIWKGDESYLLTRKYELDNHFFDGLSGLEALVGHKNLVRLYLARLNVETLEPLATLTNLESLIFHQYDGSGDPNVLASLVNLKELALDSFWIGFYDTSFLSNLTKLEKLSIGTFCHVEDLSVISGLTNLEELRMYKYGEDLSFLTGLNNLRLLQLVAWDTVDDYSPLLALDNLEYLDLQEMAVYDLSVISQIESLRFLRMRSPQINNIKDVGQLKSLKYFFLGNPQVIGDLNPEFFGRSLFDGLDHLKFAAMQAGAEQGLAYELGDPEFLEIIEEPSKMGVEIPEYDYFWITNPDDVSRLNDYIGSQNLVIEGDFSSFSEGIKLTIPKNVRNLYIFSHADQPVKIELDGVDNKGLERLAIGHIDVSEDDPDGFGYGNFIIDNLNGLSGCTNLKEVYINSAEIDDISALANFDKLEIVELNGKNITNRYK